MKRFIHILIATAVFAPPAFAHDPKLHKGPKVEGKVVSVTADRLKVATKGGTVAVTLTPETKYEKGEEGEKTAKDTLRAGQHVMITGHKLESGELAAADVMIHADADEKSKPHAHGYE